MGEILVVLVAVLLLFGSKSIPEFARTLGKGMNEFKKATDDLKKEFQEGTSGIMDEVRGIQSEIQSEINQNSNALQDFVNDVEREDYSDHIGTRSNVNNDVYGLNENPVDEAVSENVETTNDTSSSESVEEEPLPEPQQ